MRLHIIAMNSFSFILLILWAVFYINLLKSTDVFNVTNDIQIIVYDTND